MIHLYCLAVQAGFYSDVVECWPVTQTARVRSPAAALVIRIFSPVIVVERGIYEEEAECSLKGEIVISNLLVILI